MTNHAQRASAFIHQSGKSPWHDKALWHVRTNRDKAMATIPEWEQLRETAQQIKAHTASQLDDYLVQFEANCKSNGVHLHWAQTPDDLNKIVLDIARAKGAKHIVKSKSMLTEECHLNEALEGAGLIVTDTDLGERIVQLRQEPPSHIVLPAIHTTKEEIGELFHKHFASEKGNNDPTYLTGIARKALRDDFLGADIGITGVNFAIAETGGIVICTNEGNADLGTALPPVHIACMGIEKLIPAIEHLGVFTRLLARSATGQAITTYTSHFHKPRRGGEMHIVMLDNGRTALLGEPEFRAALSCIRCGACMNTCPVFRHGGGHSYGATIPGPIGSTLGPSQNIKAHQSLPFACTLCGSCTAVCPVNIDLHNQLLTWRNRIAKAGYVPLVKRLTMKLFGITIASPALYGLANCFIKVVAKVPVLYRNLTPWGKQRSMPVAAKKTFKTMYVEREREQLK